MPGKSSFQTQLLTHFRTEGVPHTIPKNAFLLREGQTERHLYLIESGLLRAYRLTATEEQTIRFGYAGSLINSLRSYLTGQPSELYLEALRKTTIRALPREKLDALIHQSPENMAGYTALLEAQLTQQIEREYDLLTPSPTERLARVLARSPQLFQEAPLKYIASYLRMTPETLSRVRAAMVGNGS